MKSQKLQTISDSNNRHFVLEVQIIKQQSYKERVHYYTSKLLVQSLEKSQLHQRTTIGTRQLPQQSFGLEHDHD